MSLDTLDKIYQSGVKLTPMMEQYYEIKKKHRNDIVFFRMGDFYEVFFEDAKDVSKILNIALTHRGKLGNTPVPMAGIPHHAANNYIDRITESGRRVAVCEQVQNPKDAIGIVKRAVTQVVSPGMPYDLSKANDGDTFYICSCHKKGKQYYSVFLDYSTGDFFGEISASEQEMMDTIKKLSVKEIILYPGQFAEDSTFNEFLINNNILKSILAKDYFHPKNSETTINKFVPNFKHDLVIKDSPSILSPLSSLSNFVELTQKPREINHLTPFRLNREKEGLYLSNKTLEGLEIVNSSSKNSNYSLYDFVKKTKTPMGTRELKNFFSKGLTNKKEILKRQNFVTCLMERHKSREEISESLDQTRDIDRILTKISTNKHTPQDLVNIACSLEQYYVLIDILNEFPLETYDFLVNSDLSRSSLVELKKLAGEIKSCINPAPSASIEKRNLILPGVDKTRDHYFELYNNSSKKFDHLEQKYLKETGIPKIKIKQNNIHGRFIEISKVHSDKVPNYFTRRQTLVQSERYVTDELNLLESECLSAGDELKTIELEILDGLIERITNHSLLIKNISAFMAKIDVFQSFATIANLENWCRPNLSENDFKVVGGWHPLIKKSIKDSFTPHDLTLDGESYFGLITGPNMAGKTTVMREMAIIQVLAQIGSYVPASEATVSICDRIFSRLGASDNIQEGQSTFMVEMSETAEIIRHATSKSLVILDEIGRGTSTYDGLSIAWSLVEYLTKRLKAKTLFATHYHELIDLVSDLEGAKNLTVEATGEGDNVKFLYRLIEEGANQSYGIYVAKLAGLPAAILNRAKTKLNQLEQQIPQSSDENQLSLWEQTSSKKENEAQDESLYHTHEMIREQLNEIHLDHITPMQAFETLRSWKNKSDDLKNSQFSH